MCLIINIFVSDRFRIDYQRVEHPFSLISLKNSSAQEFNHEMKLIKIITHKTDKKRKGVLHEASLLERSKFT